MLPLPILTGLPSLSKESLRRQHSDISLEDASYDEIRTSYRTAILNSHPDKLNSDHNSGESFLRVQKAWEILSDPSSRAVYDRELRDSRQDLVASEDIGLDDMMIEDAGEVMELYYQCRCGDHFSVDSLELAKIGYTLVRDGAEIFVRTPDALPASVVLPCGSCSLLVRLMINPDIKVPIDGSFLSLSVSPTNWSKPDGQILFFKDLNFAKIRSKWTVRPRTMSLKFIRFVVFCHDFLFDTGFLLSAVRGGAGNKASYYGLLSHPSCHVLPFPLIKLLGGSPITVVLLSPIVMLVYNTLLQKISLPSFIQFQSAAFSNMGVFYQEEQPHQSKRCKFLATVLKEAFSNCHTFNGQRSDSCPEEEYSASAIVDESEVVVSEIRSRAMEKMKSKPSRISKSPFLVSKEAFLSANTDFSRCSSLNKTEFPEIWKFDFQDFRRRSIIHEFCHCEGWPFRLCKKTVLLPPSA
ncbi:hypothetical protein V6N11_082707 [Hibiscus sabdariffa]|uniref:Uncharacterized protein n=1 Tax=Hibiscus sabdariffa TaxID=183260 RepID=A0ABR2A9J7_9ROSI